MSDEKYPTQSTADPAAVSGRIDISTRYDCLIVGAGFAGLYSIYKLREMGLNVRCFEAADDVGGVWNFNSYPGAQCDVPSRDYAFHFSQELLDEWKWSRRYAGQPEILAYARHVADKFELRKQIAFGTRVTSAIYDAQSHGWVVTTSRGETVWAQFCIMASGHLSTPNMPQMPGLEGFSGEQYHTGHWPRTPVDLAGKRVGVIGTGSTGIQLVVNISKTVGHLCVFQRTAQYSLPIANDPADPLEEQAFRSAYPDYAAYKESIIQRFGVAYFQDVQTAGAAMDASAEERERVFEALWNKRAGAALLRAYNDTMTSEESNRAVSDFVRRKIRSIVKDPIVAEQLVPREYPIGAKRIAMDEGYYAAFNRPNVELVDIRADPIERVTPTGIKTAGAEYALDVVIFATGYDAFTGTLFKIDIRGRHGLPLQEKWQGGAVNYLGLMTAGFPNLFVIQGPGSTSVLANVMTGIDQQVNWIADCIGYMQMNGLQAIDPNPDAELNWVAYCNEMVGKTLFLRANSWWLGANIPGKPRVFLPFVGGFKLYREKCAEAAANGYVGFDFQRSKAEVANASVD
jgi:cyclohexanone monooxygenase